MDFQFLINEDENVIHALGGLRQLFHEAYDEFPEVKFETFQIVQKVVPSKIQGQIRIFFQAIGMVTSKNKIPDVGEKMKRLAERANNVITLPAVKE